MDAMTTRRPPVDHIVRTRDLYSSLGHDPYRWVRNDEPPPWTELAKPLRECRVGLVGSGGVYRAGQVAFHHRDDISLRVIDTSVPVSELRTSHFAYDQTDARIDPNVVFPVDTLHTLAAEGVIGELSPRAYAFMGGIYSARRVREVLAPEISRRLAEDQVDLALLVPV
jgi:D-proline reductase (dithiol) PrdB